VPRELIDLLWRDHPDAPPAGTRGPRARVTTSDVVDAAIALADDAGLAAVTVRRLAADLGTSAMSLYTYVSSREDLLVLMADTVRARQRRRPHGRHGWAARVRRVAEDDRALYDAHPWLLDVTDQRSAFGPGTIAKYDHELHAFDGTGLDDVERDAALTFVLDFIRAAARASRSDPPVVDLADTWRSWNERLAGYLGPDHALAQRVGAAAGAAMNTAYSPEHAWRFGVDRVLDALTALVASRTDRSAPSADAGGSADRTGGTRRAPARGSSTLPRSGG